jgi:hypothetical protein
MGTDGARGLLFCAAKRSGTFPPNMPAGLRLCEGRLVENDMNILRARSTKVLDFKRAR